MIITPENVLSAEHAAWLAHPVTIQMIKNLQKHKQQFVKAMSTTSGDMSIPTEQFRLHAYGITTVDGVESWVKDTTKFVAISERQ